MASAARADVGERASARDGARVSTFWVILVLMVGAFGLAHDLGRGWERWNLSAGYGDKELDGFSRTVESGPDGFLRIVSVKPDGALAAAGVRSGEEVRLDRPTDAWRTPRAGETIGFTIRRGGALSHRTVSLRPRPVGPQDRALAVSDPFSFGIEAVICLMGMFVALRSRRRASPVLLGAALVCLGLSGDIANLAESDPRLYPAWASLAVTIYSVAPVLLLAFALAARRDTRGDIPPAWRTVLIVYAAVQAVTIGYTLWLAFTARALLLDFRALSGVSMVLQILGYLLALLVLGLAWRESQGRDRVRYAFMLVACGLLTVSKEGVGGIVNLTGDDWTLNNPLAVIDTVGEFLGSVVFAYAVLRLRVIDLGFAVNRTLIYGVVSAILLAAFGLVEWAVVHFLPIQGRENNALVDAAIAVAVFLTFHRVRDVVEHVIERLFFRRWQKAEARLRQFVREAPFATRAETLTRGFAAALTHYTEGAQAAVYLLDAAGRYHLAGGAVASLGESLDTDDPALIAIRAEPRALMPDEFGSLLDIAVAAPMVNRNEVIGLAVLGPKPSGLDFRPDEIELVGWATLQVGLDLHALKMEQLESAQARQTEQISVLNAKIEGLLAGRTPA